MATAHLRKIQDGIEMIKFGKYRKLVWLPLDESSIMINGLLQLSESK